MIDLIDLISLAFSTKSHWNGLLDTRRSEILSESANQSHKVEVIVIASAEYFHKVTFFFWMVLLVVVYGLIIHQGFHTVVL